MGKKKSNQLLTACKTLCKTSWDAWPVKTFFSAPELKGKWGPPVRNSPKRKKKMIKLQIDITYKEFHNAILHKGYIIQQNDLDVDYIAKNLCNSWLRRKWGEKKTERIFKDWIKAKPISEVEHLTPPRKSENKKSHTRLKKRNHIKNSC